MDPRDLKLCPFCGHKPKQSNKNDIPLYWVTCSNCGAVASVLDDRDKADASWNRRCPVPSLVPEP